MAVAVVMFIMSRKKNRNSLVAGSGEVKGYDNYGDEHDVVANCALEDDDSSAADSYSDKFLSDLEMQMFSIGLNKNLDHGDISNKVADRGGHNARLILIIRPRAKHQLYEVFPG